MRRREGLILNISQHPSPGHICLTDLFRSKSGTRNYIDFRKLVSVSVFYIISYPQTQWLKTITNELNHNSVSHLGSSSLDWFISSATFCWAHISVVSREFGLCLDGSCTDCW